MTASSAHLDFPKEVILESVEREVSTLQNQGVQETSTTTFSERQG
jgi:hypothetical protein